MENKCTSHNVSFFATASLISMNRYRLVIVRTVDYRTFVTCTVAVTEFVPPGANVCVAGAPYDNQVP